MVKSTVDNFPDGGGDRKIEELLNLYPAPTHLQMDNRPEFIAHALQEWCIGSGSETAYIEPGSPWKNPFAESFNGRFTDEFLYAKPAGGHTSNCSPRYRKRSCWQSSTESSTTPIDSHQWRVA